MLGMVLDPKPFVKGQISLLTVILLGKLYVRSLDGLGSSSIDVFG